MTERRERSKGAQRRLFREQPDDRLRREVRLLRQRLTRYSESVDGPEQKEHLTQANCYLEIADLALADDPVRNEDGWAAFHAARREEIPLLPLPDRALLSVDLEKEADEKLRSWRKRAVEAYPKRDERTVERLVRIQQHLDEVVGNNKRIRDLQRAQFTTYVVLLLLILVTLLALELFNCELVTLGANAEVDSCWALNAALYGTLGGAFSAALRVAGAGSSARYPEHLTQRIGNTFRAAAGGAAALVAFAALQAGLLGNEAVTGPRVAFVSFVAGFGERFIPSLAKGQPS